MVLTLGVSSRKSEKTEEEVQLVLSRAECTCACCGVQSAPNPKGELLEQKRGFMYLVVDDEGHEKVVCTLCYYAMNMDKLTSPRFIYYPWLSQEQLNYLLHYLYTIMEMGVSNSHASKASSYFLKLCSFGTHLNKLDLTLAKEPLRLVELLAWLQMEEPESYLIRNDKYLKGIRLIPFDFPAKEADIKAAFAYAGILLHEENIEDKWQELYLNYVRNRQQGITT